MPSLVEIGPVVLEKKILKFHQCFFAISLFSPLGRGLCHPFIWTNKIESSSFKDALSQVLDKISPAVLEKIIENVSVYFRCFVSISSLKRAWPFIWTNWNPHYPRMLSANLGKNCPFGSGEDFKILPMYFCYFAIISPWKRAGSFIWTNLNPLHAKMLCAKFGWN